MRAFSEGLLDEVAGGMNTLKVRGPWEVNDDLLTLLYNRFAVTIKEPGGSVVGYIYTGDERWEDQSNARLVAAAPELFLLAAEVLVERGEESGTDTLERLRVKAQHLIDKIGGSNE